jgi:hypothetical protein
VRPVEPPYVPPTGHVPELASYLARIEIGRPLVYRRLMVYPVVLCGGETLGGRWWTVDQAFAQGILAVTETAGGGSVPLVIMENRSRRDFVFAMAGEIVSGGKQTRTFRQDVILAPGQRVDVPVWCVEQHRWRGEAGFRAGGLLVPQSMQKAMRAGADQRAVWAEVDRNNAALGASAPTASLEDGLQAPAVRRELDEVRRSLCPQAPQDAVGFIFVDRFARRGVGAEFFGRAELARALLPKLLDAYAVDFVVPYRGEPDRYAPPHEDLAQRLLDRIRAAGSYRAGTPGSGSGIRTADGGLVGDGAALGGELVHFGCQAEERIVPMPMPAPRR